MRRPPIPAPPYRGGCLCGVVRYSLRSRPLAVNGCHCDDCKKLSGATHFLMVMGERASFVHESGELSRYRKRADSGRDVDIIRCANCGVRLWHEPASAPKYLFIAVGTLDDQSWAIPTSHIWVEKASPGVSFEDDAIKVTGQPADRQTLVDAFARIYSS
jgi:hypothetical protein